MYVKARKYTGGVVTEELKGKLIQTRNGQHEIDTPTGKRIINVLEWVIVALPLIERIWLWIEERWDRWNDGKNK